MYNGLYLGKQGTYYVNCVENVAKHEARIYLYIDIDFYTTYVEHKYGAEIVNPLMISISWRTMAEKRFLQVKRLDKNYVVIVYPNKMLIQVLTTMWNMPHTHSPTTLQIGFLTRCSLCVFRSNRLRL